jgi:hypothetical protein
MKKLTAILSVALFLILTGKTNAQNINNEMILSFAKEINKRAPIKSPDGITILSAAQGKTLIYKMYARDDINQDIANMLFNSSYKKMACLQEAESFWLKKGVTLIWNYVDKKGTFLASLTIRPKDCGFKE